ncbi:MULTISPECIES: hypothetical protein [Acinetobacter]|jgi:hypothetical protein|nr:MULTISPECIES: hypothetical protein [Acinetobacter]AVH49736.1 hypothetical protein C3Y93_09000 [Acinetobacter sp. SWBY1]MBT0888267.1 hypothetical protein [Acinetobacter towneri]MCO8049089.1 hypothetical protein [Acinetobacter towneri]NWJ93675.1 hypothetical protein [Acinetobacter sp. Swhac1]QKY92278.1 hypothetical protein HUK62_17755 [Acinetobacter sp. NEB 394]
MKLLSFILLFVSCSCFALSSEEFDKQYQNLNGELNKAVINNMIYSKDYDDKKIPLSEKIESKSKWCDLTKTRINLLDFVIQNFSSYKEWVKKNNLDDDSSLDDFNKFYENQQKSYIGCMAGLEELKMGQKID